MDGYRLNRRAELPQVWGVDAKEVAGFRYVRIVRQDDVVRYLYPDGIGRGKGGFVIGAYNVGFHLPG
ncbi:MAG: hypothetical protein SFV32_14545 [Opitutaceae bacterium]|nr:hypothetical protein [Opitutaceae bacterium]